MIVVTYNRFITCSNYAPNVVNQVLCVELFQDADNVEQS